MEKATIIDLTGYLGGLFLMISFVPQVYRSWKLKETDQISILLLVITLISAIFYEIYAYFLSLTPVLIMNGIFGIVVLFQFYLTIKYRTKKVALS